ncbi:MAG: PEP-CTERM sorting domain-containing protein [Planctomycetota bacterium]|jgi:hypothetical protein
MKSVLIIPFFFLFLIFCPAQVCRAAFDTGTQDWSVWVGVDNSLTGFSFFINPQDDEHPVPDNLKFTGYQWEDDDPLLGFTGDSTDIANWQWDVTDEQVFFAGPGFTNDGSAPVGFKFRLEFEWELPVEEKPVYMDAGLYNGGLGSNPFVEASHWGTPGESDWIKGEPYEPDRGNPAPEPMTILLFGSGGLFLVRTRRR